MSSSNFAGLWCSHVTRALYSSAINLASLNRPVHVIRLANATQMWPKFKISCLNRGTRHRVTLLMLPDLDIYHSRLKRLLLTWVAHRDTLFYDLKNCYDLKLQRP